MGGAKTSARRAASAVNNARPTINSADPATMAITIDPIFIPFLITEFTPRAPHQALKLAPSCPTPIGETPVTHSLVLIPGGANAPRVVQFCGMDISIERSDVGDTQRKRYGEDRAPRS